MLYNVEINKEAALDRDILVVKLYKFLRRYVPTRLIYENDDDREDCIQDTIMFILKRYDDLILDLEKTDEDWRDKFNYEKYFYNRARSYISYWIRKLKKQRDNMREYIENAIYLQQYRSDYEFKPIIYEILDKIIKEYNFDESDSNYLGWTVEGSLRLIGYDGDKYLETAPEAYDKNRADLLRKISYVVIDEYLVNVLGED